MRSLPSGDVQPEPGDLVMRDIGGMMPVVLLGPPTSPIEIGEGEVALVVEVSKPFGDRNFHMHVLYKGALWFTNSSFWRPVK